MARPIVLIATTDPAMAYALQERLKGDCKTLGLKLEVCPDGNESDVAGAKARAYDSAEALFDALEKRDPVELADTLVVLDVGAELDNAFRPAANKDEGWHVTARRAGVAVELLLRFPQLFPVFLSPAVPVPQNGWGETGDSPICPIGGNMAASVKKLGSGDWLGYSNLQDALSTRHMGECKSANGDPLPKEISLDALFALATPLHFVSPLDGAKGLTSTLARFARGMRCWFDPTGLRTLVKNRFLGTVFGNNEKWVKTTTQREVLLDRLDNVCVAIDEEREFALLNAYTAWKFGRRAWVVTTFGEFDDSPLWVDKEGDSSDVIVLRDIDVRFPDIPDSSKLGLQKETSPRDIIKDIYSCLWSKKETRKCNDCTKVNPGFPGNKIGNSWRVRAVSSEKGVRKIEEWKNNSKDTQLGQSGKDIDIEYLGLKKPIGTIYDLKPLLVENSDKEETIAARIDVVSSTGNEGGHGAPYSNLAMAEALLISSGCCKDHSSSHLIGALLAMEAYELLLGMSKTTALEALLAVHKHEAAAEVSFPGVSHSLNIKDRKEDVEQTMSRLYENEENEKANDKEQVKRMFLSQFWAELRIQYKEGEQFNAAEEANVQSLLNMSWKPKWLQCQKWGVLSDKAVKVWAKLRCLPRSCDTAKTLLAKIPLVFKIWVLRTATSISGWILSSTVVSLILTIGYGSKFYLQPDGEGVRKFFEIWSQVILSMLQMQFKDNSELVAYPVPDAGVCAHLFAIFHLGISYVLFGLLISMIYRKITRA